MFFFFINKLAAELFKTGKHGIQLIPGAIEIFLLLFADDVILSSNVIVGLQNQLDSLKREADRLYFMVNLENTNVMFFVWADTSLLKKSCVAIHTSILA